MPVSSASVARFLTSSDGPESRRLKSKCLKRALHRLETASLGGNPNHRTSSRSYSFVDACLSDERQLSTLRIEFVKIVFAVPDSSSALSDSSPTSLLFVHWIYFD